MVSRRSLATLLVLALLLVTLPAAPLAAADEGRELYDAAAFKLAKEAIVTAEAKRAGATWKDVDAQTKRIIEHHIQSLKDSRKALAQETRRELKRFRGREHACERALLEQAKKELDAELAGYLKQLRHVRGDQRKALTKMGRHINQNLLKPLGKVAEQALKLSLPELATMYLSGGAISRTVIRTIAKRNAVRVVRRQGRDLLARAAIRKLYGPAAPTTADAIEQACGKATGAGIGAGASPDATADARAGAFASGAWQLGECTGSAQFSLEGFMPAPPYSQPYTLVRFDWPRSNDVMLTYFATSGDPEAKYPTYNAVMDAGCTDAHNEIANNCGPLIPLVFTQAPEATEGSANSRVVKPGAYTLAVEPKGACIYETKNGDWDYSYRYPSSIEVTATIEHYRAGESAPYAVEGPLTASVPFWADDPFAPPLPGLNRRALGEFEWDGELGPEPTPTSDVPVVGSDEPAPWDAESSPTPPGQ